MHHLVTLVAAQLLHLPAGPGPVLPPVPVVMQHRLAAPTDTIDAVDLAAVAYTAYLTDLLSLTPTQQRQLAQPTRLQLRQLYNIQTAPTSRPDAEAAATIVAARYHRQLARVLTTSQYGNLVIFGGALEALPHRRNKQQVNAYWTRKALAATPAHYAVSNNQ
ncbi:hypothetical protein GCM10022409_06290 [Hymenobacter glaciei]|uniref:Uncharacterized protein n=1 Tax=Hymenobacter glaciei TaxID=877209 RepID=A0ABP7TEX5_9BACT